GLERRSVLHSGKLFLLLVPPVGVHEDFHLCTERIQPGVDGIAEPALWSLAPAGRTATPTLRRHCPPPPATPCQACAAAGAARGSSPPRQTGTAHTASR